MKHWRVLVFSGLLVVIGAGILWAQTETITLTTYYPSPRGVYDELRTAGDVYIGDVANPPTARLHVLQVDAVDAFRVDDVAADTTPFVINQDGRVGIGDPTPNNTLHIFSADASIRLDDDDETTSFTRLDDVSPTNFVIEKRTNVGFTVIAINPRPMDGVGNATIRVFRTTNTVGSKRLILYRGDNTATAHAQIGVDGRDSFFQIGGGNLGIGITPPARRLHVNGTVRLAGLAGGAAGVPLCIEPDGDLYAGPC